MSKRYFGNCINLIGKKDQKLKESILKGRKRKRKGWEKRERYKKEE